MQTGWTIKILTGVALWVFLTLLGVISSETGLRQHRRQRKESTCPTEPASVPLTV